jgi:hypothetical protein
MLDNRMKSARFFINIIGFGALSFGVGFAAESPRQPSKEAPRLNAPNSVRPATLPHVSEEYLNRSSTKSSQPAPLHPQTPRPSGNEIHQPAPKKTAVPAHSGSMMNKIEIHHDSLAKLSSSGASTALLTDSVRSRSATPPVNGALNVAPSKSSTATLSGLAVKGRR